MPHGRRFFSVVVSESNFELLFVATMLICSSRLAGMPAATKAASKYRAARAVLRTHRGSLGFEPGKAASQTLRICGLMFSTRGSLRPSVCT